jgi:hypothetical protein
MHRMILRPSNGDDSVRLVLLLVPRVPALGLGAIRGGRRDMTLPPRNPTLALRLSSCKGCRRTYRRSYDFVKLLGVAHIQQIERPALTRIAACT